MRLEELSRLERAGFQLNHFQIEEKNALEAIEAAQEAKIQKEINEDYERECKNLDAEYAREQKLVARREREKARIETKVVAALAAK